MREEEEQRWNGPGELNTGKNVDLDIFLKLSRILPKVE